MIDEFRTLFVTSLTFEQVTGNLVVALLCGLFIAWMYRYTYRGPGYTVSFVQALVYLAMITAVVIMVIGNNLARAFGLVGAMSIIRFRTAVKDTSDIVYIFFTLAVGMAAGVGLYKLALAATLFIGTVMVASARIGLIGPMGRKFLLQFTLMNEKPESAPYLPALKQFCRKFQLINVKADDQDDRYEISFYISLKNEMTNYELVRALKNVAGVSNVNLFYDEEAV
jgi:uncharacterized membrane protein YhiD involved in acid resistance